MPVYCGTLYHSIRNKICGHIRLHVVHSCSAAIARVVGAPSYVWNTTVLHTILLWRLASFALALQSCSEVGSKVTAFQSHLAVVNVCISKLNYFHCTKFVQHIRRIWFRTAFGIANACKGTISQYKMVHLCRFIQRLGQH